MLFVLSGPWGVGKSESIKYLSDNYEFQTLIPWSTKITSENLRGTKYNLLLNSNDGYKEYTQSHLMNFFDYFSCPYLEKSEQATNGDKRATGFWCQPFKDTADYQVLGYRMEEIMRASNQNAVVIEADTAVAKQLKLASEQGAIGRVVNMFLNYDTEECFRKRLDAEQSYSERERKIKKAHRAKEIKIYNENTAIFDYYIASDNLQILIQDIVKVTLKYIRETPNMLHKKSGILSEYDVQLSLMSGDIKCTINHRYQGAINRYLKGTVYENGVLDPRAVKSSSIDLYLSPECRVLRNVNVTQLDLVMGGDTKLFDLLDQNKIPDNIDASNPDNFKRIYQLVNDARTATFHDLFEENEISLQEGLLLNPQDIVLCSSLEDITLGPNIIAFITSKYSFSQIGLSVTLCQNILQPCHTGKVMLQLKNNLPYPIVIYPYMQIAQCVFFRTVSNSHMCCQYHDEFSSPRYDSSDSFKELTKEIIKNKNWYEINHHIFSKQKAEKKAAIVNDRRVKWQFRISIIASVIAFLSLVANILLKILIP